MSYHWLHPHLRCGNGDPRKGQGVWTTAPIPAGALLLVWGGRIIDRTALKRLPKPQRRRSLQIDESLFIVSSRDPEPADLVNHSCDPNAGLRGQIALEALIDLDGETELTFDYAMSDGSDYDEFPCACGADTCRGYVRGTDWRLPDLQRRYAGHFSPYLARRISASKLRPAHSKAVVIS